MILKYNSFLNESYTKQQFNIGIYQKLIKKVLKRLNIELYYISKYPTTLPIIIQTIENIIKIGEFNFDKSKNNITTVVLYAFSKIVNENDDKLDILYKECHKFMQDHDIFYIINIIYNLRNLFQLSLKGTDKVYDNILDIISDTDVFIPFLSVVNSLVITKKLDPTVFRLPFDEFKACLGDEYFELLLHRIIHQLYIKVNNLKIQNIDVLLPYKKNKEFQSPMYKNNLLEKLSNKLSGFDADGLKKQYESGKINIFKYLSLCEQNNINIDFESMILSEMKNYNLDTILNLSIENNFFHGVKYTLESGRSREDIDNILIKVIESENNLKIIKYLIDLGASIKSNENEICRYLIENKFEILEYFLNNYTFSKSNLNKMLLKLCGSFSEKINKIKLLVENGADINYKNENYQYPLHNSLIFNSFETVKYLLEHGAIVKKELINLAETQYNTPKEIIDLMKKYYNEQND